MQQNTETSYFATDIIKFYLILEYIYNYARTYFIKNSWEKQSPAPV